VRTCSAPEKRDKALSSRASGATRLRWNGARGGPRLLAWRLPGVGGALTIGASGWRLRKARSLVKLLALARGHRLHRGRTWTCSGQTSRPRLSATTSTTPFTSPVGHSKSPLQTPPATFSYRETCSPCALMERCGWTPRPSRRPPPLVAACRAAIELYAGELLPEDCYEEWTQERRAELRRTYLELLAGLHEKREEYEPAIEVLRLAVSEEPRFGPVTLQTEIILQLPDHPLYELPFAGSPGAGGCGPCPLGAVMRRRRHEGPVPLQPVLLPSHGRDPLSARKTSCPSEATRNSPMGRSSELAGDSPKAGTTPSGLTERATLKAYTHSVLETLRPTFACPANRPLRQARTRTKAGTKVVSRTW